MRLIKYKDKVRLRQVRNEDTGRQAGWQTEHKSGRVDAVATPETIRAKRGR